MDTGEIKISVKDSGPGIAEDQLKHLFDRYYRTDHSGQKFSGLGLGLYISSDIIKNHCGKIGIDCTVGQGSEFWFTIPHSENYHK
ncbi:MAG: ATP-binding protein [Chryseobacterium sp.]|nr:MAG: ATP-binding protein [Chryseobacterium sp.]